MSEGDLAGSPEQPIPSWYRRPIEAEHERLDGAQNGRGGKVSEAVARQIIRDIHREDLKPGATLPSEAAMLGKLKVARASLREALRILEVLGLIQMRIGPRGGPVVQEIDSAQLGRTLTFYLHLQGATFAELLQARRELEPLMARMAAKHCTDDGRARLVESLDEARAAHEANESDAFNRASREFHTIVARCSGNRILDLLFRSLQGLYSERFENRISPANSQLKPEEREAILKDHQALAYTILAGRPLEADRIMTEHMGAFPRMADGVVQQDERLNEVLDWH